MSVTVAKFAMRWSEPPTTGRGGVLLSADGDWSVTAPAVVHPPLHRIASYADEPNEGAR